jgi:hypothetical protein
VSTTTYRIYQNNSEKDQVEEHTMKSLVIKKDMMLLHIILQKGTRKSRRILPNTSAKHARVRSGGQIDPSS